MPPSPSVSGQANNGCIKQMMGDISPETTPEIAKKSFNENYPHPPVRRNLTTSSRTPNYLKASTGSCHDFCKFGKACSNESKPRFPFQRRAASKSADDQVFTRNNVTLPQVKKRSIKLRSKSFPAPKSSNLDHISNVRKEKPSQLDRRKPLLVNEKLVLKPGSSNLRKHNTKPLVTERVLSQRKERRLSGISISLPKKSIYVTARCVVKSKEDVKEDKSLSSSSRNSSSCLHTTRRSIDTKKPLTLSSKPVMGKRRTIKSVDPRFSVGKRLILSKEKKETDAAAAVDKAAGKYNEEESCQSLAIAELVDEIDNNNEYIVEVPVTTTMSVPNSPALSFQEEDHDGTCSQISHCQMISSSLVSMEEEEEIVMENGNGWKASSSSEIQEEEDVHNRLGGTAVYSISDFDENEVENHEATRSKAIHVEEEDAKPVKLQFRKSTILELQSESDNASRRLRFRRIGEKQEDANVVALKKIIMDRARFSGGGDNGCFNQSDAKVVLRHSDHQRKTEVEASLLNNVIEETASKLVETRKSKVKALVGAFETVMSFHDTKPNPSSSQSASPAL